MIVKRRRLVRPVPAAPAQVTRASAAR
jgi:hypothetical protein